MTRLHLRPGPPSGRLNPNDVADLANRLEEYAGSRLNEQAWIRFNGGLPDGDDAGVLAAWADWLAETFPDLFTSAPPSPASAPPRSWSKILLLQERARNREDLFHPDDAALADHQGLQPEKAATPDPLAAFVVSLLEAGPGESRELDRRPPRQRRRRTERERNREQLRRVAQAALRGRVTRPPAAT